jgi:hypothetical protein
MLISTAQGTLPGTFRSRLSRVLYAVLPCGGRGQATAADEAAPPRRPLGASLYPAIRSQVRGAPAQDG